jgi:hypothetical protein
MNKRKEFALIKHVDKKQKINTSILLTAVFLLFAMSSCLMPELSPELYVDTLTINAGEVNINSTSPGVDDGFLVIKNSTPDQVIHSIRIKYPDGSYKIIPTNIVTGEEKTITLPKGDYEVSISEDGIYYSGKELVTIEPASSLPEGKTLDTADKFQPPGWWKTGGHNTDPAYPSYNPDPDGGPGGGQNTDPTNPGGGQTDPGSGVSYPTGYLTITNNYSRSIDIVQVTYIAKPDGSTSGLPVINPIPGAGNPQTLTLDLDPPLGTGESIEIPLPIGKYKIRVGYQGTNAFPIWFGKPVDIEREIEEGGTTLVELETNGTWGGSGGGTIDPGTTDPGPVDPPATVVVGSGYIVIRNIYPNSIINIIEIQSMDTPATLDPNPTGTITIPSLGYNADPINVYYYAPVPYGKYKVRVGFSGEDDTKWYNGNDWNVIQEIEVGNGSYPNVPHSSDPGNGPTQGQPGYYNPSGHTMGYVQVKNSGSSTIWGIAVNSKLDDKTFAMWPHWGSNENIQGASVPPDQTSPIIENVPPGKKYVHVWFTKKGETKMQHAYKDVDILADVLTIPIFYLTVSFETWPIYTTPPTSYIGNAKGSIQLYNGQMDSKNIIQIVIANYGQGTYRYVMETIRDEKVPTVYEELAGGTVAIVPGTYSQIYELPPGRYRVAVKKTDPPMYYDYYGASLWTWKLVHVQAGLPVVLTFDGSYIKP